MSSPSASADQAASAEEQEYLAKLYRRLDDLRERAAGRLAATLAEGGGGTLQERSQRNDLATSYADQVARYAAVESGLCFGRLDFSRGPDAGRPRYIGRIGIFDEGDGYDPLLLDWRAPAARPFYLATAAAPDGVRRRRHIRTRQRRVVGVDDEVLDLAEAGALAGQQPANGAAPRGRFEGLVGEATLLAAMNAGRTGRMRDIVQTIQAEQDRVIRADLGGVLVVQGGPGTGKTAVALHRAAYLLYTYRDLLASRGVLVVGPNGNFLRYISEVLPALAETGVLLRTIADLYPGVAARGVEPDPTAALKGRPEMVEVLAAAVRDRQRVPEQTIEVVLDRDSLHPVTVPLEPEACARARDAARRTGRPHNEARSVFAAAVIHELSLRLAELIGTDPYADDPLGGDDAPGDPMLLDGAELAEIRRQLGTDPGVRSTIDSLWPALTPQRLLADLYACADRIDSAAPELSTVERAMLLRPVTSPAGSQAWTPADVPLLDEAAQLLGGDEEERRAAARAAAQRRRGLAYAEGALEILRGSQSTDRDDDPELTLVTDLLDPQLLAERQEVGERLTAVQRAAADRRWAFGHVIVDEAQELSAMAWRMLMRRCPSRSVTVVGDIAQTGDPAGASSWEQVLRPYVADRWRLAELTVNYRTPAEVMAVAGRVLADIDPGRRPPDSVRATGVRPWVRGVPPERLAAELGAAVGREAGSNGDERLGVLVPAAALDELGAAIPGAQVGTAADLASRVVVLTVRQAKGLEFDSVIVVDPAGILTESPRGRQDLYVALTRPTQRLGVLCPGDPPLLVTPLADR
ncbi:MAG: AAA family ATPase [Micromonosporaceae bacterium]|nr:AAA family ATPase [Micromonosporaceae bacterium]